MKIIGCLIKNNGKTTSEKFNLDNVPFFFKNQTREILLTIINSYSIVIDKFQIIKHEDTGYILYVYNKDNKNISIICDDEYPKRVVATIMEKIIKDEIDANYVVLKCNNPIEIDQIMRIQDNLENIRVILHQSIEEVLNRGEKLDDLILKSNELSKSSKDFYGRTRKLNSCCSVV